MLISHLSQGEEGGAGRKQGVDTRVEREGMWDGGLLMTCNRSSDNYTTKDGVGWVRDDWMVWAACMSCSFHLPAN